MSDKPYPIPKSLKDDWRGWVVDQDIRVIEPDNITAVETRRIPDGYRAIDSSFKPGFYPYGQDNGLPLEPPSGFSLGGVHSGPSKNSEEPKYTDLVKNIQNSCVAPGTVESLFSIPDSSCMLIERWSGYNHAWSGSNLNNYYVSYAGSNAVGTGTKEKLTNEFTEINGTGTFDINNIKLWSWPSGISLTGENFTYPTAVGGVQRNGSPTTELHNYIDVEKNTPDGNIYWNDYDIWDIKRLYKDNYNDPNDDQRKMWWNNLYNPYCHDMFEWVDTGLRSNDSTMRMTCGYEEINGRNELRIFNKNFDFPEHQNHQIHYDDGRNISNWNRVGQIDYYRGPDEAHPLHSILNDTYMIPDENGEMIPCENCKNKAAVSWDKTNNGLITGFTDTLDNSTFTERELRDGFKKIVPAEGILNSGFEPEEYYIAVNTRGTDPTNPNYIHGGKPKLIPEIIGTQKSGKNVVNLLAALREPVVVNITTAQAMRFCNENDNCAGFLHYRIPDNYDYLRMGNSICNDERQPDYIKKNTEGGKCYSESDTTHGLYRLSGTLTSNSWTPSNRIKNLFIFKKKIGSDDPNDPNWGPNIEADELIRPNKYVYCVGGQKNTNLPPEYENFKISDLFSNAEATSAIGDGLDNKCAEYDGDWFNKLNGQSVENIRDTGIANDGICVRTPAEDGTRSNWGVMVPDSSRQDIRINRANTYLLERCRDKKISPLRENVSGEGSKIDDILYRNLPAYVYKKKPRPDYTRSSYKKTQQEIYNELNEQATNEINTIVSNITDINQVTGNYTVNRNGISVPFDCGNIADDYIADDYVDDNCTSECLQDIEMKSLYRIHCEIPTNRSSSCDCLRDTMEKYETLRDHCIRDKSIHKEYLINTKEKANLDKALSEYYNPGSNDPHNIEWFNITTNDVTNHIKPYRKAHHPSSIYIESLGEKGDRDYTNLASSNNMSLWDNASGGNEATLFVERSGNYPEIPRITCCINDIDLSAGPTGHIEVSGVRQCMQCGDRESDACSEHVEPGGLFGGPSIQIPGTSPPPGPFDGIFDFFNTSETSQTSQTNINQGGNDNTGNNTEEESWLDELINYITELFN